jgi:alpha-glucosidase (family GH31 glycosyl hydrolase)
VSVAASLIPFLENDDANRALIPNPVSNPMAFAIFDVPRIIPPAWGYNVAPNGSLFPEHNGWDTTNYSQDIYVFLPNGDGRLLRSDFLRLTGKSELVPLYGLGVWNSRWYAYTQAEALAKIDRYRSSGLPLDVLVIDTDWRVGGSSGYDVNTTLFPNMAAFFPDAHSRNAKIVFNDHPEPQASSALSPAEVVFRNNGLRGKLALGLDFWWFDRNWSTCIVPPAGLNKEVFGMYLYQWVAADYAPGLRPFIMANADGVDNGIWNRSPDFAAHRYTCQWTGDISPDYASLQREVSNAVHYGVHGPFAYVSADLGGHVSDPTTNQFCRWLEYGALSPFFRPHCTKNLSRDPWDWPAPVEALQRAFTLMRMRLLPVFYNAARLNYDTGEPIVRRCDQDYPVYAQAAAEDQYLIGSKILVAPIMADVTSRNVWVDRKSVV